MESAAAIGLRFVLYADLLILFGVAAWPFHARPAAQLAPRRGVVIALALVGLVVSAAALWMTVAAMTGAGLLDLDRGTLSFVLRETPIGTASAVRAVALLLVATLVLMGRGRLVVVVSAAVAVATLAWSGHAAATEGTAGTLHRAADIAHLLAAGVWLGARVILAACVFRPLRRERERAMAVAALGGFARTGSVVVATMIASGAVNLVSILGIAGLPAMPQTTYGRLLLAKLALFGAMLGLAAINRWRLTPALAAAGSDAGAWPAERRIRLSIMLETTAAILILVLVAWLGTLDPGEFLR